MTLRILYLIDPFIVIGSALLPGKLIYFAKILVGRWLNNLNETLIDVTSYFDELYHFALQKSRTAGTLKGSSY